MKRTILFGVVGVGLAALLGVLASFLYPAFIHFFASAGEVAGGETYIHRLIVSLVVANLLLSAALCALGVLLYGLGQSTPWLRNIGIWSVALVILQFAALVFLAFYWAPTFIRATSGLPRYHGW